MKKVILILVSLFLTVFCFANGRCEKLEKEILKNPNVIEVKVGQYDKWSQEIYFADINLTNGGFLTVCEFGRDLSGKRLYVEYIGRNPAGKIEYEFICGMDGINCRAMSALFNKNISSVDDIINNYDELYKLAEALAQETPEERSLRIRMKKSFIDKHGNYDTCEYWGVIFAKRMEEEYSSMFADE